MAPSQGRQPRGRAFTGEEGLGLPLCPRSWKVSGMSRVGGYISEIFPGDEGRESHPIITSQCGAFVGAFTICFAPLVEKSYRVSKGRPSAARGSLSASVST